MSNLLKRELRVALSPRCQPMWFRLIKWSGLIAAIYFFHDSPHFWPGALVALLVGFFVHFLYRWKTHAWTRAWGGWSDIESGR
jgi:hypothetical protein